MQHDAYRMLSDIQSACHAPFERPDKVHLRQEIKASRPPGGDPLGRKRDSDGRVRTPPAYQGHDTKRQIVGDLQQDVCLICGHQEGGREPPPGTTSHPKPVKGGLKCATEQLPHT